MRIDPLEYLRPQTLEEALALLEERGAEAKVLGGGSDLVVRMKLGIISPKCVIDINGIPDLKYIDDEDGSLRIGAATTLRAIEKSSLVSGSFPSLATAAASVASFQIRSTATVAGNICLETMCWYYNQSRQWKKSRPACYKADGEICHVVNKPRVCYATYRGDTAVALIALGAQVKIQSFGRERIIPLEDLFAGDGKTAVSIASREMITEVRVPSPLTASGNAYFKISHRNAVDYPQAAVAAAVDLEPGNGLKEGKGKCVHARIVLGAVDSKPVRAVKAEELIKGQEITGELLERVADRAVADAHPVNNMTFGSPAYRRKMVRTLGLRALSAAIEKARQENPRGGDR